MSLDPNGLRRRSPNPNSPIPYSPALLSPYIPHLHGRWNATEQEQSRSRYLSEGQTPTIRLVQPTEASGSANYAPQPLRTRSDDQHVRASTIASSVSNLRRHGTDPKSYPTTGRFRGEETPSVGYYEKPVPPLPLDIRKTGRLHPIRQSSALSIGQERRSGASTPYSTIMSYSANPSAASTPRTGRSMISSLKTLQNPFTSFSKPKTFRPLSPTLSMRSGRSNTSFKSSSSMSSQATLPVPFYATSFWRAYSADGGGKESASMVKIKGSGSSSGISEKVTDKFPVPAKEEVQAKEIWTGFKVILLFSVLTVLGYGFAGLIWAISILLRMRTNSDVTMVSDPDVVIFLLLASLLCIFSAMVGLTGVLLNSRPILAFYNLLLWPTLLSMCLVGYTSYKRGNLQLDRKLNQTWSQILDDEERLRIQNSLKCCGYFSPAHDATYSKRCYPRTLLPGCKGRWMLFERKALHDFATAAFSTIPFHLINITCALLCSNHVDRTFGKGLTPVHYRLRMADVRSNALAVLASLPTPSRPTSLHRQPATRYKPRSRPNSIDNYDDWTGSDARYSSSRDTLTETMDMKRTRSRQGWVGEMMREAGPRGRALREARDRGVL